MNIHFKYLVFIFGAALLLMFAAFFNAYPIVYSDTSTYLASGFQLETPFDRPITYGLFLRLSSLNGLSLWGTIFFQALITSFLIVETIRIFIKEKFEIPVIIIIAFLSFFTGLSWTVSQLIPDIFTPLALLSMILILFHRSGKWKTALFYFIFLLSAAMHMSHLLLFSLILFTIILLRNKILPTETSFQKNLRFGILLLLIGASILTMGSALSKSRHVFFMGAMLEHGILKEFLDDNCITKPYSLCPYKDSLPGKAYVFIWDKEKSPLYKTGSWNDVKPEYNEIINATLTQPKYIKMHIAASLKASADQLLKFKINDGNGSFLKGTVLYERVDKYVPGDIESYSASMQNQNRLGFTDTWNILFTIVIIVSILILLILPQGIRSAFKTDLGNIILITLFAVILNGWDCGTFANAIDRLGCKMIWMLPMFAAIILVKMIREKNIVKKNQ
ncbi:MAG: hypothetical protein K0S44_3360 [Bacteroidetes bacterium]|jgi:hypothetical protein|nr:hypothetical protein [Bacteroidota bacterium]